MEFVFLAVLLMVPLFYLVMTVSRVQAGAYAASTAAREAGRAYVTAVGRTLGSRARAEAAARIAFEDQGFGAGEAAARRWPATGRRACDRRGGSR